MQKKKIIILLSTIFVSLNISAIKLYDAVLKGNLDKVKHLVEKEGANVKNDPKSVLQAFYREDKAIFKYLIKKGANIDLQDVDYYHESFDCNDSFIHKAADDGNLEIVRFLAENGANLVLRNRYGQTPLDEVLSSYSTRFEPFRGGPCFDSKGEILYWLTSTFGGNNSIENIEARNKPKLAVIKYLEKLEKEAFNTFLKAAKSNNLKLISYLLDKKLKFDYTNDGKNLLHIVASLPNISLDIVKELVARGVEVDEIDSSKFKAHIGDFIKNNQDNNVIEDLLSKFEKMDKNIIPKEKRFDQNDTCTICIEELKSKKQLAFLLKCKHMFCKNCIEMWQAKKITDNESPNCPTCRKDFTNDDILVIKN